MWRDPVLRRGCGGCLAIIIAWLVISGIFTYLTPR